MALSPFTHPDIYKTIVVGGKESPGTVTLSGHDNTQEWELRKAKGTTGTRLIFHGRNIMQFTATFNLADDTDRDAWVVFQKMLDATTAAGGVPKALSCYHPDLVAQGLSEVVVSSVGGVLQDPKGGATVAVKFIEHRPTKKHKPLEPVARKGTTVIDPNAALKNKLNAMLDQAKAP